MPAKKRRASAIATPTATTELNESEIAQRAYQRWLARGCPQTDGREDWFAARAELQAETPRRSALRRLEA